jgi:hypothetical protein
MFAVIGARLVIFAEPFSPLFCRLMLAACGAAALALVIDGGAVL